jgi:hypothetical protein
MHPYCCAGARSEVGGPSYPSFTGSVDMGLPCSFTGSGGLVRGNNNEDLQVTVVTQSMSNLRKHMLQPLRQWLRISAHGKASRVW